MKLKKHKIDEIPQSSMSDIAFLLLVFFIATTIFNTEQGLPMTLPGKTSVASTVNPKNVLKISSDASGNVFIGDDPIAIHELAPQIEERLAENDKLIVSIESHPESRYEVMVEVLDQVKLAKATRVSLKMRLI